MKKACWQSRGRGFDIMVWILFFILSLGVNIAQGRNAGIQYLKSNASLYEELHDGLLKKWKENEVNSPPPVEEEK